MLSFKGMTITTITCLELKTPKTLSGNLLNTTGIQKLTLKAVIYLIFNDKQGKTK